MLDPNDLSDINELLSEDPCDGDGDFGLAAAEVQRISSTLAQADLLEFYGYYKQATEGACNTKKPFLAPKARAKWDAWSKLGDMSQAEAKCKYVLKLQQVCSNWQPSTCSGAVRTGWVVQSVLAKEQEALPVEQWTIYDFVKEGNVARVRELLEEAKTQIDKLDEVGMGLLHWAADRGDAALVQLLLDKGAQVDLQDGSGQTALHYAASLDNVDCMRLLLQRGANADINDEEGSTARDVASAESKQIFDNFSK